MKIIYGLFYLIFGVLIILDVYQPDPIAVAATYITAGLLFIASQLRDK